MSKLNYDGREWRGVIERESEYFSVSMSDETFQRYLATHLKSLRVPNQTVQELLQYSQWVSEQRYRAVQHLMDLELWRNFNDPEVSIVRAKPKPWPGE